MKKCSYLLLALLVSKNLMAQPVFNPNVELGLAGWWANRSVPYAGINKGFTLDETELSVSSTIDSYFEGTVTTILSDASDALRVSFDEAFISTTSLPFGLKVTAGRVMDDRHLNTDNFAVYPLFFEGVFLPESHNGAQLSWTLPTPFYAEVGAGAFDEKGSKAYFLASGENWQFGSSYDKYDNKESRYGFDFKFDLGNFSFLGEYLTSDSNDATFLGTSYNLSDNWQTGYVFAKVDGAPDDEHLVMLGYNTSDAGSVALQYSYGDDQLVMLSYSMGITLHAAN